MLHTGAEILENAATHANISDATTYNNLLKLDDNPTENNIKDIGTHEIYSTTDSYSATAHRPVSMLTGMILLSHNRT